MIIGIPKEVKTAEYRVSLPPNGVGELVARGHKVLVQKGAGEGSAFSDQEYIAVGATIVNTAAEAWNGANLVIKVKEPQPQEYAFMRPDLVLFTYLHLAATRELTEEMSKRGITGVAYETVEDALGRLPLLEPMSEVAGRIATQIAAYYLMKAHGGRGLLLGGVPGVAAGKVVVLGGGTVGTQAAKMALGMGADVTILDINIERLRYLDDVLHGKITTLYSNSANIAETIKTADAVIGAVLLVGAKAPHLIRKDMLKTMKPGSVIVDVSVDQGGCVETTKVTTHTDPVYFVDGVLHYGVANMPGAVPRTSSLALSNATLRYALRIADMGVLDALRSDPGFAKGLNTYQGKITHPGVAEAFNMPFVAPEELL